MKKLYTTLMIAMMGLMTLSFTSCETDEEIANTLEGTWRGDMRIEDYNGVSYTGSEITFLKDPYTYLCIEMSEQNDKKQYALLEIPTDKVDRIIQIPNEDPNSTMKILIMLDDIIRVCLYDVFKGFFNYSSITVLSRCRRD